jgi:hypothetical protein
LYLGLPALADAAVATVAVAMCHSPSEMAEIAKINLAVEVKLETVCALPLIRDDLPRTVQPKSWRRAARRIWLTRRTPEGS